jgi:glycosyltransferase involved in cell wall biosynthesis
MSPTIPGLRIYAAIYSARLDPSKRHELAAKIASLLLVYPYAISDSNDAAYRRMKAILPQAMLANHEFGAGTYEKFGPAAVVKLLGHARVGLALTAAEGCMRASMEYMLAGLPVVSTRSIGGRDRYLHGNYCRIVGDDPDHVARAVWELCDLNLDRRRIRVHVAELLAFDRYNFLLNANKLVKSVLGRDDLMPSIEPLMGAVAEFEPLDRIAAALRKRTGGAEPAVTEARISG